MGKILVLYERGTGNTGKMAILIANGPKRIPFTEVLLKRVDDAASEDIVWCGTGLYVATHRPHELRILDVRAGGLRRYTADAALRRRARR